MGYKLYESESLAHAAKGSTWANHKYIDKFFKNGKWVYIYKGAVGNVRNSLSSLRNNSNQTHTVNEYKTTKEYYSGKNGKMVKTTEKTRNGSSWLSKKIQVQIGNEVVIYKDKGKIAQGVEKAVSKGGSFIKKLSKKKKTSKSKKNNRIKVTSHTTTLG